MTLYNLFVPCPDCAATGVATHEDRHTETNRDICRRCAGTGQAPARTGETPEASFQPALTAQEVNPSIGQRLDPVVEAVRADLHRRSQLGIAKYGTTLGENPDGLLGRLRHAYEESLDLSNYLQWAMMELEARAAQAPAPAPAGETLASIRQWAEETFGPITPERTLERADEEMAELRVDPTSVEEAADVIICLARYPGVEEVIQRKMAVNRTRRWWRKGDGTGYHLKFRTGDRVRYLPTSKILVVAYADPLTRRLSWCGWPEGENEIHYFALARPATDEEHRELMWDLRRSGGRRWAIALRLYGDPGPDTRPPREAQAVVEGAEG